MGRSFLNDSNIENGQRREVMKNKIVERWTLWERAGYEGLEVRLKRRFGTDGVGAVSISWR